MVGTQSRVRITIERDERNRELILEWSFAPGFENRKFFQVDGAQRERIFQYNITWEEPSEWTVRAILIRNDGSKKVDALTVSVN